MSAHDFVKKCVKAGLDTAPGEVEKFISSAEVSKVLEGLFNTGDPAIVIGSSNGKLHLVEAGKNTLDGPGVYIMRINPQGVRAKDPELDLAYGEIPHSPLEDFDTVLARVYEPLLKAQEDWGKCNSGVSEELLENMVNLGKMLGEAIENVKSGIRLTAPDVSIMKKVETKQKSYEAAANDQAIVKHCLECMGEWITQVETVISEAGAETTTTTSKRDDDGPRSELTHWRLRAQKFSTFIDQLQRPDLKKVVGVLKEAKNTNDDAASMMKRWRVLDNEVTDAANEAKDNLKYLGTLDKYMDVLYSGTVQESMDILPALLNNVKMMQQISRYYNTNERMTTLYVKLSNQLVNMCRMNLTRKGKPWDQNPDEVVAHMQEVRKMYNSYLEHYEITSQKIMLASEKSDNDLCLDETVIFGKIELFIKRVEKCCEIFTTIGQFAFVAKNAIEGMEDIIGRFTNIVEDMRRKPYDILDYNKTSFERDYLDFQSAIHDLESMIQGFINLSFETIPSTEAALTLLARFQKIIQRDTLQSDLDQKQMIIFQTYGLDLDFVQRTYEKFKTGPPLVRTMPPVAGSITWSRQLLRRIEEPMASFASSNQVMSTKESKKIIRTYNKVAAALIEFETLWVEAWCKSIDAAKAGLQATLIVRHPGSVRMYANFDPELLQLIRETKCLVNLGVQVPESAKMLLMQDEKFKTQYGRLLFTLKEYERVVNRINPVIKNLLKFQLEHLDETMAPGLSTISWTSLAIDDYLTTVESLIGKLDDLLTKMNDIIEARIESNLKIISRSLLVDLDEDKMPFVVEEFVMIQDAYIKDTSVYMDSKNLEVELAVQDLLELVDKVAAGDRAAGGNNKGANPVAVPKLVQHYNRLMYHAVLTSIKASYYFIKTRVYTGNSGGGLLGAVASTQRDASFFSSVVEVDMSLSPVTVVMKPSLSDIQDVINRAAISVLRATKRIVAWGQDRKDTTNEMSSFFEELAGEKEVVKYVLMLTGALLGAKIELDNYLDTFGRYQHLWSKNMQKEYDAFITTDPSLEDFDDLLCWYMTVEKDIDALPSIHQIGVISLQLDNIKQTLTSMTTLWKSQYTANLLSIAREDLNVLVEYMTNTTRKFNMTVETLDDVRKVMGMMHEVREKESELEWDFGPLEEKYDLLQRYGVKALTTDEIFQVGDMRKNWAKLKVLTEEVGEDLGQRQQGFKTELVGNVKKFKGDIKKYRTEFTKNGPGVQGISPSEAISRLSRAEREFGDFDRKYTLYNAGEVLFGMQETHLDEMTKTRKELKLLKQLYGLYENVDNTVLEYNDILWVDVLADRKSVV